MRVSPLKGGIATHMFLIVWMPHGVCPIKVIIVCFDPCTYDDEFDGSQPCICIPVLGISWSNISESIWKSASKVDHLRPVTAPMASSAWATRPPVITAAAPVSQPATCHNSATTCYNFPGNRNLFAKRLGHRARRLEESNVGFPVAFF